MKLPYNVKKLVDKDPSNQDLINCAYFYIGRNYYRLNKLDEAKKFYNLISKDSDFKDFEKLCSNNNNDSMVILAQN
ncbi:hypothetical protein KKB18_01020 [bacterium]|nr:hypothetical protein [bacterium]